MKKCWKYPPCSSKHAFTLFLMFDATQWKVHAVTQTVHQTRCCQYVRPGKSENVSKLILTISERTRCLVVFDNEKLLHKWKIHLYTSIVERQLTDWGEVTTRRDLHGILYSHNDIVWLLIESNCTELEQLINMLMWVARLFHHSVAVAEMLVAAAVVGPTNALLIAFTVNRTFRLFFCLVLDYCTL
jgi:hypothetical protein